ncbi:MAG: TatD family hydrolase [Actinobacteria bacterium]|nr:TatD family hydrolase [Actinomycetota bacterium]
MIEEDTGQVVERARSAGVGPIITIGINIESTTRAIAAAESYPGVFASAGIHPNDTAEVTADDIDRLAGLAASERVVAVGETGLDFYRDASPHEAQKNAFREQVRLAKSLGKALIVHDREAHDDALDLLADERAGDTTVVMHCFSGDESVLSECLARGYYISFAGPVTFKNAERTREVASRVPVSRLLAETDSPFLSPEPFRGRPNLPERVTLVARALAGVWRMDPEEMGLILEENAGRAFGLGLGGAAR